MNKLRFDGRFPPLKPAHFLLFVIPVLASWMDPGDH